ncbi:MAG: phosphoenolpyruvate synthase, partial [Candidatus Lokiarchaeota archaeon]|nr:phosphoenolpyruvate synthase [Candidatus Lokiarchaeota archaeon]MBD3201010.1 phosphoenolpyruvate synthase [Candidatus Lokiarchaeota archaeon]
MKEILWFDEINDNDLDTCGGKGVNLGLMVSKDFPIPPGYLVTSKAYFDFIDEIGIRSKIKNILKDLNVEETKQLQEASKEIGDLILNNEMSQYLKEKILKAYSKLKENNNDIHVAVRSSATAEDLPGASFAGQQDTYLGINENNLINSVMKCWASLFTARAIYYREKNDFSHMDVGIAVIIQKLIEADVAGVMFSRHPSSGENKVIIEAGFGLGDAIVSGSITPDTYIINPKKWKIEDKQISTQSFKIVREGNKTIEVELNKHTGKRQKLPDEKIIQLAKIGKKIENYYEEGQDMEWAYSDKLYILQSRPITTISENKSNSGTSTESSENAILKGLAASPGIAGGIAKQIKDASQLSKITKNDILVTNMTTPDMVPAMKRAQGIVTNEGGMTSHAAIVSRELGIPCVVGTSNAMDTLDDGMEITVNGNTGEIYKGLKNDMLEEETEKKSHEKVSRSAIITGTNLYVNLSSPEAAEAVSNRNVDGV